MIVVIDFGSQYNQLIARRVRENRVYCQIEPPDIDMETLKSLKPDGIILSGGRPAFMKKTAPALIRGYFHSEYRFWGSATACSIWCTLSAER
jgi:GMP synthase (glutamine-hydrolysing)